MVSHRPQQLLWGLDVFRLHVVWLRHDHLTNVNPCQCQVCNGRHRLPSICIFWSMVADLFACETTVFTLQLGNFLPGEPCGFATSRTCGSRVRCNGKRTTIQGVGWTLVAIGLWASGFCVRARRRVCVCLLVVPTVTKVSCRCSEFDVLQILIG